MTENSFDKDLLCTYEYKGNHYFIKEKILMKHPETQEWIEAVLYQTNLGTQAYVRSTEDFFKKFKKVL